MTVCPTILKCNVSTHHTNDQGVTVAAGMHTHQGVRFLTCCVNDPLTGCQHISGRPFFALILLERLSRVLRLSMG